MSFADIINALTQKKKVTEEAGADPQRPEIPIATEAVPAPAVERKLRTSISVDDPQIHDLDEAIHLFESIQDIIDDDQEILHLPLKALFSRLDESKRGPSWDSANLPEGSVGVDAQTLLEKLKLGRIELPYRMLSAKIPEGWVVLAPDDLVELDLPTVYSAIPPDLLEVSSKISDLMEKVVEMPDYFREQPQLGGEEADREACGTSPAPPPAAVDEVVIAEDTFEAEADEVAIKAVAPEAEAANAEPTPAAKAVVTNEEPTVVAVEHSSGSQSPVLRPAEHRPRFENVWEGREHSKSAVAPIDLNTATSEDIVRIRGAGGKVAAAIMRYREIHGSLESIYDLLSIPGIGPANFEMMTGLKADDRDNRHAVLNRLIGFTDNKNPTLPELAERTMQALNIQACIVAGKDGMMISKSSGVSIRDAELYSSLAPKIFRGVGKYIPILSGKHPNLFALPGSEPKLLFVYMDNLYMVIAMKAEQDFHPIVDSVSEIADELDWLFSTRAIVSKNLIAKT